MRNCIVIGSGFAGLSAAGYMAKAGWDVTVVEQHDIPGGRARQFSRDGFVFDMGPSWYWMPEVFEDFFNNFGYKHSDFYQLDRLDPSYRVYWEKPFDIPASYSELLKLFESIEPGSGPLLDKFLKGAAYKYEVGIRKLVKKPGLSWLEFVDAELAKGVIQLDVFTSMSKHIRRYFKDERLVQLLAFPVLFLGAMPDKIPALYSLMNYADMKLGTWYPQGGMYEIVKAMKRVASSVGVKFEFNTRVREIVVEGGVAGSVIVERDGAEEEIAADIIIGAADYHFIETQLLPEDFRSYTDQYWNSRIMAPSCLLYYVGVNKKIQGLRHHNLFFDTDFDKHGKEIYEVPTWPSDPLFYVCAPSVTDRSVAPENCENLFFLIPVASGMKDSPQIRQTMFNKILSRFEKAYGPIKDNIILEEEFGVTDFMEQYNAFRGNAYGLANTLRQTAILKPSLRSKKVKNLFYTGQLTVPGPGVPPAIISGEIAAMEVNKIFGKYLKSHSYDPAI